MQCSLSANIENRGSFGNSDGLTLKRQVLCVQKGRERGWAQTGCRAGGAGGWCRAGLVAVWWSLGQEEDTEAGARDKELGGREHKGHGGSKGIFLFSSFLIILSMCVFSTGCAGSSLLCGLCSSCSKWELCFSCGVRTSCCKTRAAGRRLSRGARA